MFSEKIYVEQKKHIHCFLKLSITLRLLIYKQMILILYKNFMDKIPIIIFILTTPKANYNAKFINIESISKELGNKIEMDSVLKFVTNSMNDFGCNSL